MARKLKTFEVLGLRFRTTQTGAVSAFEEINRAGPPDAMEVCRLLEIQTGEDEWLRLDTRAKVNEHIKERTGFVPAHAVLEAVLLAWSEVNTGFMRDWKPLKVPGYLRGDVEARVAPGIDPIIASLINSGKANLRELEEYYSLEDAIRLFDVNMAANITQADASYRAAKEAKSRR
ncbi:hypothetical protein P3T43_001786 [Paraburkholderia sp. GAS41]|uniref:hypothetical protein n=1 Tax=Paraburkholderia sp. GAS41 TaxID=3035134 RepID=UPI003D215782